jgi:hypothetical protein
MTRIYPYFEPTRPYPANVTNRQKAVLKNKTGKLMKIVKAGERALRDYNPNDERTSPAVRRIIEQRGGRAGFFVSHGVLFQLVTGMGEFSGVAAYYPASGAPIIHDTATLAEIFNVAPEEIAACLFPGN